MTLSDQVEENDGGAVELDLNGSPHDANWTDAEMPTHEDPEARFGEDTAITVSEIARLSLLPIP